jgi:hypothetical protein
LMGGLSAPEKTRLLELLSKVKQHLNTND